MWWKQTERVYKKPHELCFVNELQIILLRVVWGFYNVFVAKKKIKNRCEFVYIKIKNAGSKGDENLNSIQRWCKFFFFKSLIAYCGEPVSYVYGSVIWIVVDDL